MGVEEFVVECIVLLVKHRQMYVDRGAIGQFAADGIGLYILVPRCICNSQRHSELLLDE